MVRTHRYPGDLRAVLSRARPTARAGADDDARGRGWNQRMVHETDAARGGARIQLRLSASTQETVATDVRANVRRRDAELLSAASVQSQLCDASRRLVRAESPGRRFCGDLRDLAHAGAGLAQALRGLESVAKTRIHRRANEIAGRETARAHTEVSRDRVQFSKRQAQDL